MLRKTSAAKQTGKQFAEQTGKQFAKQTGKLFAKQHLRCPALNLLSDATRLLCDILPWIGMAPKPRVRNMMAMRWALLQLVS
jgi:hypothetical protein